MASGEISTSPHLDHKMTLLDVLSQHRQTEAVFRHYEAQTGSCLCCHSLFDTLEEVAQKYHLDLAQLLAELAEACSVPPTP